MTEVSLESRRVRQQELKARVVEVSKIRSHHRPPGEGQKGQHSYLGGEGKRRPAAWVLGQQPQELCVRIQDSYAGKPLYFPVLSLPFSLLRCPQIWDSSVCVSPLSYF